MLRVALVSLTDMALWIPVLTLLTPYLPEIRYISPRSVPVDMFTDPGIPAQHHIGYEWASPAPPWVRHVPIM
jgi:hypothetical protein